MHLPILVTFLIAPVMPPLSLAILWGWWKGHLLAQKVILKRLTPRNHLFLRVLCLGILYPGTSAFFIFPTSPTAGPGPWDRVFAKSDQSQAVRRQRVDMKV